MQSWVHGTGLGREIGPISSRHFLFNIRGNAYMFILHQEGPNQPARNSTVQPDMKKITHKLAYLDC